VNKDEGILYRLQAGKQTRKPKVWKGRRVFIYYFEIITKPLPGGRFSGTDLRYIIIIIIII
jgi:hypothetical protein